MKIHILFQVKEGPWGGANQFLKALRNKFREMGVYEDRVAHTDVVLFNSHHELSHIAKLKLQYPKKMFLHRLDGPISLVRGKDIEIDRIIFNFNQYIADAVIFQSEWSRKKCYKLGMKQNNQETVIINAPDPLIFNRDKKVSFTISRKTRLVATSWSPNWKKGFEVYRWLDENLDFDKYEMTFVGNSPLSFKNIKHVLPLSSEEIAKKLKRNDIFITASQKDPCSNSLIEALHCGLPAIALNDGGHPEISGQAGQLFEQPEQIPALLENIVNNYDHYQSSINLPSINDIGGQYLEFIRSIYDKVKKKEYIPKKLHIAGVLKIKFLLNWWRINDKWNDVKAKVLKEI